VGTAATDVDTFAAGETIYKAAIQFFAAILERPDCALVGLRKQYVVHYIEVARAFDVF